MLELPELREVTEVREKKKTSASPPLPPIDSKVGNSESPANSEPSTGNADKTEDAVSEGYKSGDDILEIDTTERFDEEDVASEAGSVYFKSLETNFNIPKVSSAVKKTPEPERRGEREVKTKLTGAGGDKRRERKSRKESSSGERERRGRSSSRSRRRKPRSVSRSRLRRGGRTENKEIEKGRGRGREERRRSRSSSRSRRRRRRRTRSCSGEKRKTKLRSETERRPQRLTRRSQSLSPSRLEEEAAEVVDIDQVEIKEDLSLAELRKIKEKIKGKMGLNDDLEPVRPDQKDQAVEEVEDGEVLSEEEEEDKKTEDRNRKIQDLRQKLSRDSNSPVAVSVDNRYVVFSSRQFTYLMLANIVTGQHQSSPTSVRR